MKRMISLLLSVVLTAGLVLANAAAVSAESSFVISDECVELLKSLEGFDEYPRWDYSQWTIGYGSRCPDEDLERYQAEGITEEEADALLREHADSFGKSVNSFIDKYGLNYGQNQFDALVLFTYNFGSSWMFQEGNFRSGLINGVTGNDFLFLIGQWCHAGGEILKPLINRRLMETNIFFNNIYSSTVPDNYCYVIFEFNGGEGITDVQAYDSDLPAEIRVIPTREGYTFAGWYTANEGGTKVTSLDQSVRNMTLYARWVEGGGGSVEAPPSQEDPEESDEIDPVTVTVVAEDVNVRSGPGTDYDVVGSVSTGDTMTITEVRTGSGYTWGKFDTDRWIALMYTNYDEVISQQPEEEMPPQETPEEDEPSQETPEEETPPQETPGESYEIDPVTVTVVATDVNIRSGPGTDYAVVGSVSTGDTMTITEVRTGSGYTWGKFDTDRWIALMYTNYDEVISQQPEEETPSVYRIAGQTRVETAFAAADQLKELLGVDTFDSIIIANGDNFADALAGSYLANVKGAPILLFRRNSTNIQLNLDYITENLTPGGTVYILGGESAVSAEMEAALAGFQVERLFGDNRFATNLAILEEAGVSGGEILICTGYNFADSLAASATGLPILLVHEQWTALSDAQVDFLSGLEDVSFTIVGGTSAVNADVEADLNNYGEVDRLAGDTRVLTSILVAEKYFDDPEYALVAYGWDYPDGLCGGPVAYALGAPLLLSHKNHAEITASYITEYGITKGAVLGGTSLLTDDVVRVIFALD